MISAAAAAHRSNSPLSTSRKPSSCGWSTCSKVSPAVGLTVVRGPATSSSEGATHRSVPVFSSSQARLRSLMPSISGQASTATVSASKALTAAVMSSSPP